VSSIDGLVSGLNTTDIITKLMALEKAPQDALVAKQTKQATLVKAYQDLNTKLSGLRDAGAALGDPNAWAAKKATSSAIGVATATATNASLAGSLSFTVNRVATSGQQITSGSVASLTSTITAAPLLLGSGGPTLGIGSFSGAGLTLGSHSIKVTQSTTGATKAGAAPLGAATTLTGANNTIDVTIGGVPTTLTLATGTNLSQSEIAAAVQTASNGALSASVDSAGRLVLSTVAEGSTATLQVSGGTALATLMLGTDGSPITGTDGVIQVDGTNTTVTTATAGTNLALASGTGGTVNISLSGGLRAGTMVASSLDTGGGSLQEVVNAVNAAGLGVTAAAVSPVAGQFRLQLAGNSTGLAGAVTVDPNAFNASLGSFASLAAAQDASLTVGTGLGAFTVTSSSNQVANVLPGVTISVVGTGSATINVVRDGQGLADKVGAFVTSLTGVLKSIADQSKFDTTTNTGGVFLGDLTVRQIRSQLVDGVVSPVSTSTLGGGAGAGVVLQKDGTVTFDSAKFLAAFTSSPDQVAALFQRGGTATSPKVAFAAATNGSRPGTYAVTVTQAATQSTATGAVVGGGAITNAETIDVRVGGVTGTVATYTALAGASLSSIRDGLNASMASKNLGIVATVQGGALVLTSTGYGTGSSFDVRSSDVGAGQTGLATAFNTYEPHSGLNVAGTINGLAATGVGQLLAAPATDPTLFGLRFQITATPADVLLSTNFGTFTYEAGVAAKVAYTSNSAVDVVSGSLTTSIASKTTQIEGLKAQITDWDRRLAQREATLKRKFATLETALSQMKQQSQWLAGQVNSLTANQQANR
jgi:flagellar hook-associated protein 2